MIITVQDFSSKGKTYNYLVIHRMRNEIVARSNDYAKICKKFSECVYFVACRIDYQND